MENYMSYGNSTFAIKDDELLNGWRSKFIEFLSEEGFSNWGRKGYFCGKVIYVNVNSKRYAFGWPGVKFTEPIAHTYLSIEDFKKIYKILKKYESKE